MNGIEIYKFQAKDSEIAATQSCGFNGYVFDFSIGYDAADVDDIKNIEKYLIKKNHIV